MVAPTDIACPYKLTVVGGQSGVSLRNKMAAVPIDLYLPTKSGLRLTDDGITLLGNDILRTIAFTMVPRAAATMRVNLVPGDGSGSPLYSIGSRSFGQGYAAPPLISRTGGAAPNKEAILTAQMSLSNIDIIKTGSGYTNATVVSVVGGQLAPGGKQATVTVILAGGFVTGFTIPDPGGPYNVPPTVILTDSGGGSGALVSTGLGVSGVTIVDPGMGFRPENPPTYGFTPLFYQLFPIGTDQAASMRNWMRGVFQEALDTPVYGLEPVIT